MNGTFKATITDHQLAESKNGTPSVKFKLVLSENLLSGEKIQPLLLFHDAWLTDAAIEGTMKSLTEALGWTGTDLNDFNGTGTFNGVDVSVVVEEEVYEGKTHSKVKYMNNISRAGKVAPMDSGKARSVAERMMGKIMKYRQDNPPTVGMNTPTKPLGRTVSKQADPSLPPEPMDNDLPF
jgi:hypothetical protein